MLQEYQEFLEFQTQSVLSSFCSSEPGSITLTSHSSLHVGWIAWARNSQGPVSACSIMDLWPCSLIEILGFFRAQDCGDRNKKFCRWVIRGYFYLRPLVCRPNCGGNGIFLMIGLRHVHVAWRTAPQHRGYYSPAGSVIPVGILFC